MQNVIVQNLGVVSYQKAWDYQQTLLQRLIDRKRKQPDEPPVHYFLFCEHPAVFTLGKSGDMNNLLLSEDELDGRQIEFFKINRGGDITFHGEGQVVGYPIFDLDCFFTDVHRYVRYLEEAVIRTLAEYGLQGTRIEGMTGVWLAKTPQRPARKICAIGVHLSRWVTMHGFAFNVNTNLDYFTYIIPCGITDQDKSVTSLAQELGRQIPLVEVQEKLLQHFSDLFVFQIVEKTLLTL